MTKRLRLGDMLVAAGLVSEEQVQDALELQRESGQRLGETLVQLGHVTEPQMTQVLSNQLSIPWVNLYHVDFSRELLDLVPAETAKKFSLVPVYVRHVRRQGNTLYVAMDNPMNLDALQAVADACGLPVKPMVAAPTDITNAIRVYYLGVHPLGEEEDEDEFDSTDAVEEVLIERGESEIPPPMEEEDEEAEEEEAEDEEPETPTATPSIAPPAKPAGGFVTLTLLDGTVVKLPSPTKKAKTEEVRGLTTRDLIHALHARAAGKDVSKVLPEEAWEPVVATLLTILLRKGLVADWEFVDEWKKQRLKASKAK